MENLTQRRKEEEGDKSPYYGDSYICEICEISEISVAPCALSAVQTSCARKSKRDASVAARLEG